MTLVSLTRGYSAKIDDIDIDLVDLKWDASRRKNGRIYARHAAQARSGSAKSSVYMHRVILERILGRPLLSVELTDHRDRDSLNNQRYNLRIADHSLNLANASKRVMSSSQYKGVTLFKNGKWMARAYSRGASYFLGYFDSEIEAAAAYDVSARKLFGDFANLNGVS